jgi:zona occludens toxin
MAINAYTGLMGSGKTYEVVLSVLLPAIKSGRDVVTNIRGLNYELICAHLAKPVDGCEFGKIRVVNNQQVQGGDFFPVYNDTDQKFEYSEKTVVQPGDLVAIDEAWRPWGTDSKCVKVHMSFFREHRQCVNSKGQSCDLVVISQDIGDIHSLLKNVIEMTMRFTKLKTLGMSKRYRIDIYEGAKLYKTKLTSWSTCTYDKRIFPLYKSYASESGTGVEKVIDDRQNLFKSGTFFIPLILAVVFIGLGIWKVGAFFSPATHAKTEAGAPGTEAATVPAAPLPNTLPASAVPPSSEVSGAGHVIAGSITLGNDKWTVLNGPDGLRVVSPSMVRSIGPAAMSVDGSGARPAYLAK